MFEYEAHCAFLMNSNANLGREGPNTLLLSQVEASI